MAWIRTRQEVVHRPRRVIDSPSGYGDFLPWLKKPRQPEPPVPEPVRPVRSLGWLGTQAAPPVVDTTFVFVRRPVYEPAPVPEVKGWTAKGWLGTQVAPPAVDTTFVFVRRPAVEPAPAALAQPPVPPSFLWPQRLNVTLTETANATDTFGGTTNPGQRFQLPWDPRASQRSRHEQQRVRQLLDRDTVEDNLLPDSGVTPGTYVNATVTVDRKGFVTFALSGNQSLALSYQALAAAGTTQGDAAAIGATTTHCSGSATSILASGLILPTKATWILFVFSTGTIALSVYCPVGGKLNGFSGGGGGTSTSINAGQVQFFVSDSSGVNWWTNGVVA